MSKKKTKQKKQALPPVQVAVGTVQDADVPGASLVGQLDDQVLPKRSADRGRGGIDRKRVAGVNRWPPPMDRRKQASIRETGARRTPVFLNIFAQASAKRSMRPRGAGASAVAGSSGDSGFAGSSGDSGFAGSWVTIVLRIGWNGLLALSVTASSGEGVDR